MKTVKLLEHLLILGMQSRFEPENQSGMEG